MCVGSCAGAAARCQQVLSAVLGSAAGKVIFDTVQLRPTAGSTAASADDLKNVRCLRTQTEAATIAYPWKMKCFQLDCEPVIQHHLMTQMPVAVQQRTI